MELVATNWLKYGRQSVAKLQWMCMTYLALGLWDWDISGNIKERMAILHIILMHPWQSCHLHWTTIAEMIGVKNSPLYGPVVLKLTLISYDSSWIDWLKKPHGCDSILNVLKLRINSVLKSVWFKPSGGFLCCLFVSLVNVMDQ